MVVRLRGADHGAGRWATDHSRAGGSAFAPRGTAHKYKNFGPAPARHLVMVTPGGFQRFFEELTSLNKGLSAPVLVRTKRLMNEYGVELLGPPLSSRVVPGFVLPTESEVTNQT